MRLHSPGVSPLVAAEGIAAAVVAWRVVYHVWVGSHWRRSLLHAVLLVAGCCRIVFWLGLADEELFATGLGLLCISWAGVYVCITEVVFQWAQALAAGRVTSAHVHPSYSTLGLNGLLVLNGVHALVMATVPFVLRGPATATDTVTLVRAQQPYVLGVLIVHLATGVLSAVATGVVGMLLQGRVAASSIEHKTRSQRLTVLFTASVVTTLLLEAGLLLPIALAGLDGAWATVSASTIGVPVILVPALVATLTFLYLMRRRLPTTPARVVTSPTGCDVESQYRPTSDVLHPDDARHNVVEYVGSGSYSNFVRHVF
ncbi:hypothetical protein ACHHYP_06922 [Achlya hypogyna]|uniref:Transmembrane protein n=1 Tax=Achlya hypogyna TaxID=1202772 RepID=A0A1V9ZN27_ACHHY|nr:hypothetical protein ACHHYP_06922 [Achlya hypogyna]